MPLTAQLLGAPENAWPAKCKRRDSRERPAFDTSYNYGGDQMNHYALTNAFSINMLARPGLIAFDKTTIDTVRALAQNGRIGANAIGHPDTDAIVRNLIAVDIPPGSRQTVDLDDYDGLIVAQYRGPRLEAGAIGLPEGATIEWWIVSRRR